MSYAAIVYNVMIASPGDVEPERKIVRDVIHEWNDIHSEGRAVRLAPIGWDTHSSPEMGNHPQDIINKKVLDRCDLLVGIFWTRIGTPTREHASGTVEEIEEHIKAGKPAMLYFSKKPVVLDSVDRDQYDKVVAFKNSCKDRGIYQEYSELDDFQSKFYKHLQIKMNDQQFFPSVQEPIEDISPSTVGTRASITFSDEATQLLLEARKDKSGTVVLLRHLGGTDLSTNGKDFLAGVQERREVAKWESAVDELVHLELLIDRGYKGEIFELTSKGYATADAMVGELAQASLRLGFKSPADDRG